MNHTFNFNRFYNYAISFIAFNKRFLTIMAVLFMIPAVLAVCGAGLTVVFIALSVDAALLPLCTNTPDHPMWNQLPEASELEKYITETVIKIIYSVIPFAIHAAFVVGHKSPFTDGFQIEFLLFMWIEMCFATFFATINVNTDGLFSKGSIMEPLYYSVGAIITRISFNITYIALIGLMELFFSGYGFWRHPFSLQTNCWMMVAIVVMSVLLYFLYYYNNTKRFAKYKYYYEINGKRIWTNEEIDLSQFK
ncbi:MAG: hypothetical protein IKP62_11415 [Salinivirgaceae bacterium]|nr:hypothetical protein [Salinivirgaceae bacterium]